MGYADGDDRRDGVFLDCAYAEPGRCADNEPAPFRPHSREHGDESYAAVLWGESSVVRYYDNLRLVYEVESKMRELRRDEDTQQPPQTQQKQDVPANPQGNGHKNGGRLEPAPKIPQEGSLWGRPTVASADGSIDDVERSKNRKRG